MNFFSYLSLTILIHRSRDSPEPKINISVPKPQ